VSLRIAQEITIVPCKDNMPDEPPRSFIVVQGENTFKQVPGAVLEAAVQWAEFYLLFTTDDVPFEEMLGIYLLDESFNLLDSARLGAPYSTGSFSSLRLREPNEVDFLFIGDTTWTVELLSRPVARIPFIGEPRGGWRSFGFRRHFAVHGDPKPEERTLRR